MPLQRCLYDELIVDNFAGGGGASVAMELATGRPVDIAINHDPEAMAMHIANHPYTMHLCQDVFSVDPRRATWGKRVGLAWFSPDCKHFSKAKGGKPVDKKIRDLAWVVIRWARTVRPRVIIVENVEEFRTWGPLVGNQPCPRRRGQTFWRWTQRLRDLGYQVDSRELVACDYGAPTIRKRLFIVARCDGMPIIWPEPTHGPGRDNPYRTAAECIDWSIPCPSIFERSRPLAEATMRRIARGIQRYVIDAAEPFIVNLTHGARLESISEPVRTITAAQRGEKALVAPCLQRHFGQGVGRSVDGPAPTITAGGMGKTSVVAAFLAKHYGGVVGQAVDRPTGTVTTVDHHALVSANLVRNFGKSAGADLGCPAATITGRAKGTCRDGQDLRQPMPTVTSGGLHVGEVRAFLLKYYGTNIGHDCREPLQTITTKHRFGLVTVAGQDYQIVDIGMRMLTPRELFRAQGFADSYTIDPDFNGKPLTKTAQVRMCGNSVSPYPAAALVRANYQEVAAVTAVA